jgi:hypothetical protein
VRRALVREIIQRAVSVFDGSVALLVRGLDRVSPTGFQIVDAPAEKQLEDRATSQDRECRRANGA